MKVQFEACGCDPHYLRRKRRSLWMRIFRTRRLYQCKDCRQLLLIPEPESAEAAMAQ